MKNEEKKICSHKKGCGRELPIKNFQHVRNTNKKTGKVYMTIRTICNNCKSKVEREWRKRTGYEYTEARKEYKRKYYQSQGGKEFSRERSKRWRKKNPEKVLEARKRYYEKTDTRDSYLKRKHGITKVEYEAMLEQQDFKCKICGEGIKEVDLKIVKVPKEHSLHVEHDHKTGKIRGLTCSKCNFLLGLANDNSKILENAIEYLK